MTRAKALIDWDRRYSDSSEDYILRMLLPYAQGTYVEIGVWDAKNMSNSYIFYDMGWRGLLIEPMPEWAFNVSKERPEDTVICKAISDVTGEAVLAIDSAETSLEKYWSRNYRKGVRKIKVPTIRFDDLIKEYPHIEANCDFCSIDVEGHEKAVLLSMNLVSFRPSVFCIEAVKWHPFGRVHKDWEYILTEAGYKLLTHNLQNRFYGKVEDQALWENARKWGLTEG
jgi:FkbM family methyltransferase